MSWQHSAGYSIRSRLIISIKYVIENAKLFRFKPYILLLLTLFYRSVLIAQEQPYIIDGWLKSSGYNESLPGAKICVQDRLYPENKSCCITNSIGYFSLNHYSLADTVVITASFLYCENLIFNVALVDLKINLDTLLLRQPENVLNSIDIISKKGPVYDQGDTLVFDPTYFTVSTNATVENLLEILPGVTVDEQGKIRVNGTEVDVILVNGKPFFGNDLTLTTRNLTKDMIALIEVVDTRTASEEFMDDRGDGSHKTINLVLNEKSNEGCFGEVQAGIAYPNNYELNFMLNRFSQSRQFSLIGGSNTINSSPINTNQNGLRNDLLTTNGIIRSEAVKLHYSEDINERFRISASYLIATNKMVNGTNGKRQNIQPITSYAQLSKTNSTEEKSEQALTVNFILKPNKKVLIDFKSTFTADNDQKSSFITRTSFSNSGLYINEFKSENESNKRHQTGTNNVSIIRKLASNGTYLKLNYRLNYFSLSGQRKSESFTDFEDGTAAIIRDQLINDYQKKRQHDAGLSFKIPIKKDLVHSTISIDYKRIYYCKTTDFFSLQLPEDLGFAYDSILSANYVSYNADLSPSISFFIQKEKWNLNIQPSVHFRQLNNRDELRSQLSSNRIFKGIEISSTFNYQLKDNHSINGAYYLQNRPPYLSQLLSFSDFNDPLNTVIGNPNLKSQKTHLFRIGINHHNYKKRVGLYWYLSGSTTIDQIIEKAQTNTNLIKTNTFVNTSENYNLGLSVVCDKKIIIDSNGYLRFDIALSNSLNQGLSSINDLHYKTYIWLATPSLNIAAGVDNHFDLSLNYQLVYTKTRYELDQLEDYTFNRNTLKLALSLAFKRSISWTNSLIMTFDLGSNPDISKSIWLWNSSLYYTFRHTPLKIGINSYDVLSQNKSVQRTINSEYIENLESIVLERYFMLSLSFKFKG